jgi:lipid-binding SYLF domain-containing protein
MNSVKPLLVSALILVSAITTIAETTKEKQAKVRKNADQVLSRLYKAKPSAQAHIKGAAGYAVFSNRGVKIFLAGGGKGTGIAVDNATKKIVYMRMVEVQAGLGWGAKKFSTIFVFETKDRLEEFINSGWEFGGQTTAVAKTGSGGGSYQGAASVSPGVWIYQLTEKGLALELTGKGTKYFKDDDLN